MDSPMQGLRKKTSSAACLHTLLHLQGYGTTIRSAHPTRTHTHTSAVPSEALISHTSRCSHKPNSMFIIKRSFCFSKSSPSSFKREATDKRGKGRGLPPCKRVSPALRLDDTLFQLKLGVCMYMNSSACVCSPLPQTPYHVRVTRNTWRKKKRIKAQQRNELILTLCVKSPVTPLLLLPEQLKSSAALTCTCKYTHFLSFLSFLTQILSPPSLQC